MENCEVHDYDSQVEGALKQQEMEMYHITMKIFCEFESGYYFQD